MTDEAWKALGSIFTGLITLATLIFTVLNNNRMNRISKKQEVMHQEIDGKMSELLVAKKAEGKAEGKTEAQADSDKFKETSDANAAKIIEALGKVVNPPAPTEPPVIPVVIKKNEDK